MRSGSVAMGRTRTSNRYRDRMVDTQQEQPGLGDDQEMMQATLDTLVAQRERALNEAAEHRARGQVLANRLKATEEEVASLREELASLRKQG